MTPRPELGVIEGFYGTPWSHAARVGVVSFAADVGVGTYIWAPKDQPAHRRRWWEAPSREHVAEMAELHELARSRGVRWAYGLSPVVGRGRASADARAIHARLEPLRAAGLRSFVVAFDDTWPTLLPRLATREVGRSHGEVARAVRAELASRSPEVEVRIVPAIYAGRAPELPRGALAYLRGLASAAGDVPCAWTGPQIFSRWIRDEDRRELERETGLVTWIWNNAVTNDWLPLVSGAPFGLRGLERLPGAAAANLDPALATSGALLALNAPREAELAKPAIAALAAWSKDPARFDPAAAFAAGLERAFGREPAAALAPLLDACARHALAAPWRRDLGALGRAVEDVATARDEDLGAAAGRVRAELDALATLPDRLAAKLEAAPVALEVSQTARKLALLGRSGAAALDAMSATSRGARRAALGRSERLLAEARAIAWDVDLSPFRALLSLARRRRGGRSRLLT